MIGMTRTLAMELGRDGITVNAIGPGPIATELFRQSNPKRRAANRAHPKSIAVGRNGNARRRAHGDVLPPDNGFNHRQVLYRLRRHHAGGRRCEVTP